MATKLKLVQTCTPRPFLEIVQALQLDSVQLPDTVKTKGAKRKGGSPPAQAANDGSIPESGRNNTLMSMAGAMRNKGMSESAISAALQAENLANCKPPLDPTEVSAIATSVMRYEAADPDKLLKSLTDTGNAARFSGRYSESVRYVFGMGWVVWDEYRWKRDQVAHIMELAKALARTIHQEAAAIDNDDVSEAVAKHAKASLQAPKLRAMLELAQSEPALVAQPLQLDANDMLLGVANGVVNLRTGKLRPRPA